VADEVRIARREFISLVGGAAAASRFAAAQALELPAIGFLHAATVESYISNAAGFAQGLEDTGLVEAQNLAVEYRFANGRRDQLAMLAADLVRREVAVIAAGGGAAAVAAKGATTSIPIVVVTGADPVGPALLADPKRPDRNITGVTFATRSLMRQGLRYLRELVPAAATVGYLGENPTSLSDFPVAARTTEELKREMLASAAALGWQVAVAEIDGNRDYEKAFATVVERRAAALVIAPSAVFASDADDIISLALRDEIATLSQRRDDVAAGGLMSYGASRAEAWRRTGAYVGQILKGAAPAAMPVIEVDKPELAINLTIAKALGLTVPPALLALAEAIP
jgi:putative ABC transport system substrate-binding protein